MKTFFPVVLLWSVWAFSGCGGTPADDWNDYFRLYQEGTRTGGKIVSLSAVPEGTAVQLEYSDAQGAAVAFREVWPAGMALPETGESVLIYRLPENGKIQQASEKLLKYKKIA